MNLLRRCSKVSSRERERERERMGLKFREFSKNKLFLISALIIMIGVIYFLRKRT